MGESSNQESDFIRIMTSLFKDDIEEAVKSVYKSRIKPTIKKTVSDSLKDIVDKLFGTTSTPSTIPAGSVVQNGQRTDYTKSFISGSSQLANKQAALPAANVQKTTTTNTSYNALPNYVTVSSFDEAQNVVNVMNDKLRADEEVSVNDLFDFAGKANVIAGSPTATRYGWDNIDAHTITEMADGQWMLSMPPYKYLAKGN